MKFHALFSKKKKKKKKTAAKQLECKKCVMGALTATFRKRINQEFALLKHVKFSEKFYPLDLISMLKSKSSLRIFTPSTQISMPIFEIQC